MPSPNAQEYSRLLDLLIELGAEVRKVLWSQPKRTDGALSRVSRETNADLLYGIDEAVDGAILEWLERRWPRDAPAELVMEGLETELTFPRGTPLERTRYKLIVDPIDGTRGLMHDKRSAWSLAGVAPQKGEATRLRDIVAAAMTELPTRKHGVSDQLGAVAGGGRAGARAERTNLFTGARERLEVSPSRATDLAHGFASCAKFFPFGKKELAAFEEEFFQEALGIEDLATAAVFDDQYISTGGQLYELISGRDRLVMDLRALAFQALQQRASLACHPYDLCCELVARECGVVVLAPDGGPLDAPLDTTSPVSWVGYANQELAQSLGPIIGRLTRKRFRN